MSKVILRLLNGANFPERGSVYFIARWVNQQALVGPTRSHTKITFDEEIVFCATNKSEQEIKNRSCLSLHLVHVVRETRKLIGCTTIQIDFSVPEVKLLTRFHANAEQAYDPELSCCVVIESSSSHCTAGTPQIRGNLLFKETQCSNTQPQEALSPIFAKMPGVKDQSQESSHTECSDNNRTNSQWTIEDMHPALLSLCDDGWGEVEDSDDSTLMNSKSQLRGYRGVITDDFFIESSSSSILSSLMLCYSNSSETKTSEESFEERPSKRKKRNTAIDDNLSQSFKSSDSSQKVSTSCRSSISPELRSSKSNDGTKALKPSLI